MFKQNMKCRPNDVDRLVSKCLKKRRIMLGLSQADLSEAVNVSIQQIQKYEKATNRISSGKLFKFAEFLKVPITYFYDDHSDKNSFAEANYVYDLDEKNDSLEKEITSLIRSFREISNPRSRIKIIELIKTMS